MKDGLEQAGLEIITGERKGFQASSLRGIAYLLSYVYRFGVETRLWLFRKRILRESHLGCMVVSIGNLTTGGTGKTPVVEMFARELTKGGRRVAILSRGYKSEEPKTNSWWQRHRTKSKEPKFPPRVVSDLEGLQAGMNSRLSGDEPFMLAKNLPGVSVIVGKDRVASGRHALEKLQVDTLLLDDGLQYLYLRHRLDVILVDSEEPFGLGFMLPRGLLREPKRSLKRASYIFLTKCDPEKDYGELISVIRKYNKTAEIIRCRHKPLHFVNLHTGAIVQLEEFRGRDIATVAGIARPESFESGMEKLGANIRVYKRFADHHRFEPHEIQDFLTKAYDRDAEWVVTTEKDAVRFPEIENPKLPVFYMRMEIEILTGQETWDHCVRRICQPHPIIPADRWF